MAYGYGQYGDGYGYAPGGGGGSAADQTLQTLAANLAGSESAIYLPSDLTTLRQLSDGTAELSATDPVGWIEDLSGNNNHGTQSSASNRPVATEGLTLDGSTSYFQCPITGTSDMTILVALKSTDTKSILGSKSGGGSGQQNRLLTLEDGGSGTSLGVGDPYIEGREYANGSHTYDEMHTLVCDDEWHILSHRAGDATSWTTGLDIGRYANSASWEYAGAIGGVIVIDNTAASGDAYDNERLAVELLTQAILEQDAAVDTTDWQWHNNMVWTWFNDERVIELSSGKYAAAGVSPDGSIVVGEYQQDRWTGGAKIYDQLQVDDHCNPALLKRADGKILALFSAHNSADFHASVSSEANNVRSFETAVNIDSQLGHSNYSYANAFLLGGRIYLFFRATNTATSDWAWHYSYTDDPTGLTGWQTGVQMSGDSRPYHKIRQNGSDRLDFIVNDGHPNAVGGLGAPNNLYHFYMLDTAGVISFHESGGTDITASIPFDGADLTEVYDSTDGRSWVSDLQLDGSGNPVATFTVYPGSTNATAPDIRGYQARWTGSAWSVEDVCTMGITPYSDLVSEPFYSGGICGVPGDPDTIFVGRMVDGAGDIDTVSGVHQIFRFTKSGSWSGAQLTSGDEKSIRPFVPQGSASDVLYLNGTYDTFTSFDMGVKAVSIA